MLKKLSLILLLVSIFTVFGAQTLNARRGRSFGGRSFGRSRSSRSYRSRRRSYGGYRSRRYGSRRYGYRRYGYSRGGFICGGGGWVIMGIIAAMVIVIVIVAIAKRGKNVATPGMGTIAMLQVAFYSDAEGKLRKEFNHIGQSANFDSPSGIAQFLNKSMIFIGRHTEDISHFYYECTDKMDVGRLEDEFESKVSSEKMKYDGPGSQPSEDEMEINQHVVLSVFIASERVDLKNEQISDVHALKQTVNKLAGISARSIYAVEIILDPSDAQGALSRDTMEMEFPKLQRV